MRIQLLVYLAVVISVQSFCGDNIKWSHHLEIEDVYGVWYGVGYAQHTLDMTNKPKEVGCVTLYIGDATTEKHDWLEWPITPPNYYTTQNWRSIYNNPRSNTPLSESWLDVQIQRRVKRDMYNERKLRIIWDENGQSMEQIYIYTPVSPGLWVSETKRAEELEIIARGVDIWYPDDPPRHPEVIKVLKLTPHTMIITHCSDTGSGGIFSLILRRSPNAMERWEWYDLRQLFFTFDLPPMYRHTAICSGCGCKHLSSFFVIILSNVIRKMNV
ncbi:hypothetical protein ACJJTC_007809 [Scirpophaga incertulas]